MSSPVWLLASLSLWGLGVMAAFQVLPDWSAGELPPESFFVERFETLLGEAGFTPEDDARVWVRTGWQIEVAERSPYELFGRDARAMLERTRRPLLVGVAGSAVDPAGLRWQAKVHLGLDGRVWHFETVPPLARIAELPTTPEIEGGRSRLELLLAPGETLGPPREEQVFFNALELRPVEGADAPLSVVQMPMAGWSHSVILDDPPERSGATESFFLSDAARPFLLWAGAWALLGLAALGLALRRRIFLTHALMLSGLVLVWGVLVAVLVGAKNPSVLVALGVAVFGSIVFLFVGWAAAQSWYLVSVDRQASDGLGLLLSGCLGPRIGGALTVGLVTAAALAGLDLLARAGAVASGQGGPGMTAVSELAAVAVFLEVLAGFCVSAVVLFAWTLGRVAVSGGGGRVLAVALTAASWAALSPTVTPYPLAVLAAVPAGVVVGAALERGGMLALLVAVACARLLRFLSFALVTGDLMVTEALAGGAVLLTTAVVAGIGLLRPASAEPVPTPPQWLVALGEGEAFGAQMAFLAGIQRVLLPTDVPRSPTWDVAGRVVPAHEVGGDFYDWLEDEDDNLWVVAGDVAGHDSFCAVGHAMARSALRSLIRADARPAEVLGTLHRVLGRYGQRRLFTAVSLLRLDRHGGVLWANAGYPYPLLAGAPSRRRGPGVRGDSGRLPRRDVEELELPGLPLGCGLAVTRRPEREVAVEPGGFLVLASDGLAEAVSRGGRTYGFDRARRLVSRTGATTARGMVDRLADDHRQFLGLAAGADDLTLLVLRRRGADELADEELSR